MVLSVMDALCDSNETLQLLSELLFVSTSSFSSRTRELVSQLNLGDIEGLSVLAEKNHVILRAFGPLHELLIGCGEYDQASRIAGLMQQEAARIRHALRYLEQVCQTLAENGCSVTVIKSLDHWPDMGSDLDLFTDVEASRFVEVMRSRFNAKVANRSWGDRLANKWNFTLPGLPELIEVHVGRLGQTGEQTDLTRSLLVRSEQIEVGGYSFRVAAPEDRITISTLQRMYRHFYIRLCDIVDHARLLDSQSVDFEYLESVGTRAGLWKGIATYLTIISQFLETHRGYGVSLPPIVMSSAQFGVTEVRFRNDFLRVPIVPHSASLYASELKNLLRRGKLRNSFRLSLLPGLATAAALEQKITGNDKGIW